MNLHWSSSHQWNILGNINFAPGIYTIHFYHNIIKLWCDDMILCYFRHFQQLFQKCVSRNNFWNKFPMLYVMCFIHNLFPYWAVFFCKRSCSYFISIYQVWICFVYNCLKVKLAIRWIQLLTEIVIPLPNQENYFRDRSNSWQNKLFLNYLIMAIICS